MYLCWYDPGETCTRCEPAARDPRVVGYRYRYTQKYPRVRALPKCIQIKFSLPLWYETIFNERIYLLKAPHKLPIYLRLKKYTL